MVEARHAFEFGKDCVFVREEVSDESVRVFLLHGERGLRLGPEDARGECCSQGIGIGFVSGGEVDEAREVVHAGIEGSDVSEAELREGLL